MINFKTQITLKEVKCIKNSHDSSVLCLKLLANGNLVSSSRDKSIRFWHSNNCVYDLQDAHKDSIRCLEALSHSNLASGSADCSIKIW